ncbi:flavin reductase family protein [Bianquea renquensis]|jgi:conserved protein/domain typically associated with flavoprotein oxygenases, DIM6/NTAB family|uniref:Flavin reductase family protein n=1 Tax=Bianquea renquensis TaxID=2763661 RepID=A0A926HW07_9FIRM|nr:flavin reductase family protein [Bianquea renquensis]MBC8542192.1 flavin reductase family protein [Bianquea renquensis]
MSKLRWKPGNMLYPLPAVMVSCGDQPDNYNIFTAAWTGTLCSDPPMTYVSIRPERHSYALISRTKEFVINLTTRRLAKAADFCGVRSGRELHKFDALGLTAVPGFTVGAPLVGESPLSLECRVRQVIPLGSHDMFMADILCVAADDRYLDDAGRFHLEEADLLAYSHGTYYALGQQLGHFGYSVRKTGTKKG